MEDRGISYARTFRKKPRSGCHTELQNFAVQCRDIGSDLQKAVAKVAAQGISVGQDADAVAAKVLFDFRPVSSGTAEAHTENVSFSTLSRTLNAAAAGVVLSSGYLLGLLICRVLDAIKSGRHELICVVKKRRYDKTPCRLTLKHTDGCREHGTVVKVLQSEFSVGVLFRSTDTGCLGLVKCQLPVPLKPLENNSAEAIFRAQTEVEQLVPELLRVGGASRHAFSLVNTDSYAANFCAERIMSSTGQADRSYTKSHYGCDVHRLHSCIKKQMGLLPGHISALINAALAAQHAGSTRHMRQALAEVLEGKLVVRAGRPTEHNARRLKQVLDLFLARSVASDDKQMSRARRRRLVQRCVISFFLNGDTTNQDEVVFWSPVLGLTKSVVLEAMLQFLVPALIPRKPPILSRKSWCGVQDAVDYFGLLTSLHNLFHPMIMCYTKQKVP